MTIREMLKSASAQLESVGVPNASYDAMQMLAHVLDEDALMMRLNGHRELAQDRCEAYEAILARREKREPMQYILGSTGFMGLEFHVEPGVLVPRQDTETLVEWVLKAEGEANVESATNLSLLDMCTGSGCIGLSLAKLGGYYVTL